MVTAIKKQESLDLYFEVLPGKTRKAFKELAQEDWLKSTAWYLAGGTALALQTGNRSSLDLDFFLPQADFRLDSVLKHFSGKEWRTNIAKEGTIYGELLGAKVSFIAYPFFSPQCQYARYGSIKILQPRDIAVMKVIAISQRGRKRDFFDLYWCVKNIEPLEIIVGRLETQYPTVAHDFYHIIKSLAYFADAENDPPPKIFFKADWREVKKFFQKEAKNLCIKLLGLR